MIELYKRWLLMTVDEIIANKMTVGEIIVDLTTADELTVD